MSKKIVTKRHLRRVIAANIKKKLIDIKETNNIINNAHTNTPEMRNNAVFNITSNTTSLTKTNNASSLKNQINKSDLNELLTQVNLTTFVYSPEKTTVNVTNIVENSRENINQKLAKWACKNNITHKSLNELILIFKDDYQELEKDARTLLGTPRKTVTKKFKNGEFVYFGFVAGLKQKIYVGVKDINNNTIRLEVNIDGVQIYQNSSLEFWPILVSSKNFINNEPFIVGIFCGNGKPDPITSFLDDFVTEFNYLKNNGIVISNILYKIDINFFTCDAPARSFLKQTAGHTSKNGCEKCNILAEYKDRTIFYSTDPDYYTNNVKLRKDSDFLQNVISDNHIKGISPLKEANIGLVTQFPLDPMHLVFLGVMRRLLVKYLITGKRPHKIITSKKIEINSMIINIRNFIPDEFSRKLRTFDYLLKWKATEFRFFLLYGGYILLQNKVNTEIIKHFLLLHVAITILSNDELISKFFQIAETALNFFVLKGSEIYGNTFVVYNVHNLIHLCNDVKLYGNLNNFSCFIYENFLGKLKHRIRGHNLPLQQLSNRILESYHFTDMVEKTEILRPIKKIKITENYFQCKKLITDKYVLGVTKPNNIIRVNDKIISIKSIHCSNNVYKFCGTIFKYTEDLFQYPINSSNLGIYYIWGNGEQIIFNLKSITEKYVSLPYKNGLAVYPLRI